MTGGTAEYPEHLLDDLATQQEGDPTTAHCIMARGDERITTEVLCCDAPSFDLHCKADIMYDAQLHARCRRPAHSLSTT
jgi:hypothetical protein